MIEKLIQKALPQIFKTAIEKLNVGLYKNDVIAFHITAHTSDKNFTKCVLTKIKKDLSKEVINFDMNEVNFDTLLK
jgi:hypothetical protein